MDANQVSQEIQTAIQTHNWQYVAVLGLVAIVYLVRKYAPVVHGKLGAYLNSDQGGSVLVLASGVAMSLLTAFKAGMHLTWGSVLSGVTTAVLASGTRNIAYDLLEPSDKTKPLTPLVPPASPPTIPPAVKVLALLFFAGLTSCATLKTCEINSLPQTEQSAIACAVSAASSSGDVQATITACAAGIVPSQFNCLVQSLITWFKSRVPAHGQADAITLATIQNLEAWLKAHGGSTCNPIIENLELGYAMAVQ